MDKTGVIYILTNPSFPEYVKIGYADEVHRVIKNMTRLLKTSGCSGSTGASVFPLPFVSMQPMRSIRGFLI